MRVEVRLIDRSGVMVRTEFIDGTAPPWIALYDPPPPRRCIAPGAPSVSDVGLMIRRFVRKAMTVDIHSKPMSTFIPYQEQP